MQKKCSIILITNTKGIENKNLVLFNNNTLQINDINCTLLPSLNPLNANIYVLSDDRIKINDWYISSDNRLLQWNKELDDLVLNHEFIFKEKSQNIPKKVIATTNNSLLIEVPNSLKQYSHFQPKLLPQLSQSFIKDYINFYNKNTPITEVMVDYQEWEQPIDVNDNVLKYQKVFFPKVNFSNEISTSKVKDSYTKEEVTAKIKSMINLYSTTYVDGNIDEWIKQNL